MFEISLKKKKKREREKKKKRELRNRDQEIFNLSKKKKAASCFVQASNYFLRTWLKIKTCNMGCSA
jgi:hypothetical protein